MRPSKTSVGDSTTTNADKFSASLQDLEAQQADGSVPEQDRPAQEFDQLGRYRIEKLIGKGGFGFVYLAHDEQLVRPVAIKVPSRRLVSKSEDAGPYVAEARNVAILDHPNIVPVYDVGATDDCPCYIVSRFVEGSTLSARINQSMLTFEQTAKLIATIAEALQFAHQKGLVHRDVKPGNIMIGVDGTPYLIDFGLALREEHVGSGPRYVGTPAYMSPEQARGEGHRVDGRSDVYSLGCVLYLLLSGQRPFSGEHKTEILEKVVHEDPEPLRQIDPSIPRELERICSRSLRKRAVDRYATAMAMAEELHYFLNHLNHPDSGKTTGPSALLVTEETTTHHKSRSVTSASSRQPVRIVPRGLRSFDQHDCDFFLDLLPGPRDREGLPDSLRFWKTGIEETDADKTFSVGMVYGPSGCGKSSLLKAGLLPRLSETVLPVFIEATPGATESQLLKRLQKVVPELDASLSLTASLASFRQENVRPRQKVLIVIDQFEQWLHANQKSTSSELVHALRQCDGGRLQCLVLVRDDFWLAVSRFMRALEIEVLEGWNGALVDLFDPPHAKKVLHAFGVAYDQLPSRKSELTREQSAFLDQAISELSQDGKVVPVRLAAFAEMFKGKDWTLATLHEMGGSSGIGVRFLEETFTSSTAPPQHRVHQTAARAVLKSMLPEAGALIKAPMRPESKMLQASGYADRPDDFAQLIRLLDLNVRLITPAEFELYDGDETSDSQSPEKQYQLTHDYLVAPIREWLTRKQRTSMRGRAELRSAELAALYRNTPNRHVLPGWLETLQIRLFTRSRDWEPSESEMMVHATKMHARRGALLFLAFAVVVVAGFVGYRFVRAQGLVDTLLSAKTSEVPALLPEIVSHRRWIDPKLRAIVPHTDSTKQQPISDASGTTMSRRQLHASLALLPRDRHQLEYLKTRFLRAEPSEVLVMLQIISSHQDDLVRWCWALLDPDADSTPRSQQVRAACLLAAYAPNDTRWTAYADHVVDAVLEEDPAKIDQWMVLFRPVRNQLVAPLAIRFRNPDATESTRVLAARILAGYASGEALIQLALDADATQYQFLFPSVGSLPMDELGDIELELDKQSAGSEEERLRLARRQRNAAITLIRMGMPESIWPFFRERTDPTARTRLVLDMREFGVALERICQAFEQAPDSSAKQGLLIAAEAYSKAAVTTSEKQRILGIARESVDNGLKQSERSAAKWLIRSWGLQDQTERELQDDERDEPIEDRDILDEFEFATIKGPVDFAMGSPDNKRGRRKNQKKDLGQRLVVIPRDFQISTQEVTVEQFKRYMPSARGANAVTTGTTCPMNDVSYLEAMRFCRWLSDLAELDEGDKCYPPIAEIKQGFVITEQMLSQSGYRLPTEEEWEYVARAGSETPWFFGLQETDLPRFAWYSNNSNSLLHPVGSLAPNPLGLFDIYGNVGEWCHRRASGSYSMAALRGGGYSKPAGDLRSSMSYTFDGDGSLSFTGFRIVRTRRPDFTAKAP